VNVVQDVEERTRPFVVSMNAADGPPHVGGGRVARYLLLIHGEEAPWEEATDADRAAMYEEYGALVERMRAQGHLVEADELRPAADATIVRVRDGATRTMDGPFTETKEQLGGYFLVECDLETAIGYAAALPGARSGAIEVRPAMTPTG
jgi:hypothetical protein